MQKLTNKGTEGEDGGPESGHEAVGVYGVGEATFDGRLVRIREAWTDYHYFDSIPSVLTSNNRSAEPKSVNCHSDDDGHQGFLEGQIFEGTLEQ